MMVALAKLGRLFEEVTVVDVDQFQRQQVIALVVAVVLRRAGGQFGILDDKKTQPCLPT